MFIEYMTLSGFDVHVTVHRDKFLQSNQLRSLIPHIYFWNKTINVSESSCAHHQQFFTVHTAIAICHTGSADSLLAISGGKCSILIPLASSQRNLYELYVLLCVQCQTLDDGQIYCPKHVQSYSKIKFEKSVLLFGFCYKKVE